MTDLTKITTPFGLLDEETQQALQMAHTSGKIIEAYSALSKWEFLDAPGWVSSMTYRVRPEPETTTVYVNLWRDMEGDIFPSIWRSAKHANSEAETRSRRWTLLARQTITITHGEGLE